MNGLRVPLSKPLEGLVQQINKAWLSFKKQCSKLANNPSLLWAIKHNTLWLLVI